MFVALKLDVIKSLYFEMDLPVPYRLASGDVLNIMPIRMVDSPFFLSSCDVLRIEKNKIPIPQVISMSYLQFLVGYYLPKNPQGVQKLSNIFRLCIGMDKWDIQMDEKFKPYIVNKENSSIIKPKEFDDLRRIIMYQNVPDYDDSYVSPELEEAIQAEDRARSKNIDVPTIERRMAIITAHCGIGKEEQKNMTLRSHQLLFKEIVGEIDFYTVRPMSIYCGKEIEHYVYPKKHGKFDRYITSVGDYHRSMGGDGNVAVVKQDALDPSLQSLMNKFSKN